jgi:probable HAF family extracellular repeat protein
MVGYQSVDFGSPQATVFREDGTLESLGTLGLEESWAQDVNQDGVIVGRAFSFDLGGVLIPKAFVYDDGEMLDLLDVIDNGNEWTLIEAAGINDLGVIVGSGILNGEVRGFIATPVPEPNSILVALLAAATVWDRARRRSSIDGSNETLVGQRHFLLHTKREA